LIVKNPEGKKGFSVAGPLSVGENSGVYCHATIPIRFVVTATYRIVKHNTCDISFDFGSIYTSVDDSFGGTDLLTLEREKQDG